MIGKMRNKKRNFIMLVIVFMLVQSGEAYAKENVILQTETEEQEDISVVMPTVSENEESPFDFIIDPQSLIYDTSAALYGGGVVEEGAHLLFHNKNAEENMFSSRSDYLTVSNYSTIPVVITISAEIDGLEDIVLVPDKDVSIEEGCGLYLALIDDKGNEQPLSGSEEVSISVEMNEESKEYSFGLIGQCEADEAWQAAAIHPRVKVTWRVEPVVSREEKVENSDEDILPEEELNEKTEEIIEEQNTEEDLTENESPIDDKNSEDTVSPNENGVNDNNDNNDEKMYDNNDKSVRFSKE